MYDGLDRVTGVLAGLTNEQKIIANNIANSQTPGYVRQEYKFSDVLGSLENPYETNLSQKMGSIKGSTFAQAQGEGRPVDLAQEMVEMQKTFLNYTMVTRRISTVFNNLRRATQIGR